MRLSPTGAKYCCAQNQSFRAKFSNQTLLNMSKQNKKISASDADFEKMYESAHDSVNLVRQYGGKDTVIDIGAPYDTSTIEYPSSAYYGFSGEQGPVIEPDYIDTYSSMVGFKNPILNGAEASVVVAQNGDLGKIAFPVAAVAAGIGKSIIETGEERLVNNYIERFLKSEKVENLGKTIQDLVLKLKDAKFSESAIKKLQNIKSI